ncbi:MAG: hypothetical protein WBA77_00560 [Microcoleaceae cyanobacterium]
MTEPREKAVRKIIDNYHKMSPEQQDKATEMVERIIKNDPDSQGERLDNEQYEENLISRLQDPNLSDNHREIILNDPNLSDEERERLQDISDEALDKMFSDAEQEQQAFVSEVAPQLVDILNKLDTDKHEGIHRTIEFNKEESQLSLTDNKTGKAVMTAQWHPDAGEWENKGSSLTEDDRNQVQKAWEQVEYHHQQQQDTKVGLER